MKTPTRVRSGFCPVRSGFKIFFECPVRFRSVLKTPVRSFTAPKSHWRPRSTTFEVLCEVSVNSAYPSFSKNRKGKIKQLIPFTCRSQTMHTQIVVSLSLSISLSLDKTSKHLQHRK
eukprot:sb/3476482/